MVRSTLNLPARSQSSKVYYTHEMLPFSPSNMNYLYSFFLMDFSGKLETVSSYFSLIRKRVANDSFFSHYLLYIISVSLGVSWQRLNLMPFFAT